MVDSYVDVVPRVKYDGRQAEVQQYSILRLQRTTNTPFTGPPEPRILHLCYLLAMIASISKSDR